MIIKSKCFFKYFIQEQIPQVGQRLALMDVVVILDRWMLNSTVEQHGYTICLKDL